MARELIAKRAIRGTFTILFEVIKGILAYNQHKWAPKSKYSGPLLFAGYFMKVARKLFYIEKR